MSKKLILIVDDDFIIRESLQRFLSKKFNIEIRTVSDGFEVLVLCLYLIPDLIISDIRMPKLDGISLLKGLKNNPKTKNIPVIFMSAFPDDPIIEEAKKMGALYFFFKPFKYEYLSQVLIRLLPELFKDTHSDNPDPQPRTQEEPDPQSETEYQLKVKITD